MKKSGSLENESKRQLTQTATDSAKPRVATPNQGGSEKAWFPRFDFAQRRKRREVQNVESYLGEAFLEVIVGALGGKAHVFNSDGIVTCAGQDHIAEAMRKQLTKYGLVGEIFLQFLSPQVVQAKIDELNTARKEQGATPIPDLADGPDLLAPKSSTEKASSSTDQ